MLAHGAGTGQGVSLALSNAASFVWQWVALARGQGLVLAHSSDYNGDAGPAPGALHEGEQIGPESRLGKLFFAMLRVRLGQGFRHCLLGL